MIAALAILEAGSVILAVVAEVRVELVTLVVAAVVAEVRVELVPLVVVLAISASY